MVDEFVQTEGQRGVDDDGGQAEAGAAEFFPFDDVGGDLPFDLAFFRRLDDFVEGTVFVD